MCSCIVQNILNDICESPVKHLHLSAKRLQRQINVSSMGTFTYREYNIIARDVLSAFPQNVFTKQNDANLSEHLCFESKWELLH